jgi:hypothetical protein
MNEIQNHPELVQRVYNEYASDPNYQDRDGNPNHEKLLQEELQFFNIYDVTISKIEYV